MKNENMEFSEEAGDGDFEGEEAAIGATRSRPPPPARGQSPRRRSRPTEAAAAIPSRWRPNRPVSVASYDPFNQHVASEAGPFGSRSYFTQRAGEAATAVDVTPRPGWSLPPPSPTAVPAATPEVPNQGQRRSRRPWH